MLSVNRITKNPHPVLEINQSLSVFLKLFMWLFADFSTSLQRWIRQPGYLLDCSCPIYCTFTVKFAAVVRCLVKKLTMCLTWSFMSKFLDSTEKHPERFQFFRSRNTQFNNLQIIWSKIHRICPLARSFGRVINWSLLIRLRLSKPSIILHSIENSALQLFSQQNLQNIFC